MEFFGSVTRIFGACVPSVAPCAAAAAAAAARTHPAAVRVSEQSNGFDWFSRRRRSTRRLSEAAPVPSSSPVPRRGNLACPRFLSTTEQYRLRNRLLLLLLLRYFRIEEHGGRRDEARSFYRRGVATEIYIYKRRYRNEDL